MAHNNNHGVPGGGSNNANPFYCDSSQNGYPCDEADDMGWSHVVLTRQNDTTVRLTQRGQQSSMLSFHGTNDGNGNAIQSTSVSMYLAARANTLLFANPGAMGPDIDRVVVAGASYEAESSASTLYAGARVLTCSVCSGGKKVGYIGNGGPCRSTV